MLDWLNANKQWLFSGVGAVVLSLLWNHFRSKGTPDELRPSLQARLAAYQTRRHQARVLAAEWPLLQAKLHAFSLLVAEAHPRSARTLLTRLSSHDAQGQTVTSRTERAMVEGIIRYVNHGLHCVTEDAKRAPRDVHHAKRVVYAFEFLVGGLTYTQATTALREMLPDGGSSVDVTKAWFAEFDQFLREYRTFANDTNAKLKDRLFGTSSFIPD
jgi:hypothetical protein